MHKKPIKVDPCLRAGKNEMDDDSVDARILSI